MVKMKKKFDCVRMKNEAQRKLRAEYEKRKNEFSSYIDFINAAENDNPRVREFHKKLSKTKAF